MKRLVILPWEKTGLIKTFRVSLIRNSMFPTRSHYANALISRRSPWKKKLFYLAIVKRSHKQSEMICGFAFSVSAAKRRIDEFLRLHNVTIKTLRDIKRLQIMQ